MNDIVGIDCPDCGKRFFFHKVGEELNEKRLQDALDYHNGKVFPFNVLCWAKRPQNKGKERGGEASHCHPPRMKPI